jgi:hypothetical protein
VALLEGAGLHTLKELNEADVNNLLEISGMDEARVEHVRAIASERAAQVEAEFADALKAAEHLFDEEMFDRVPEDEAEESATLTFKEEGELEAESAAAPDTEEDAALADEAPEGEATEPMATAEDSTEEEDAAQADAAGEAAASLASEPDGSVERELEPVTAAEAGDDTENETRANVESSADTEPAEEPGPKPTP